MLHSLQLAWQAIREKGKLPTRPLPFPPPLATHLSQISGTSLEQSVEIPVLIGAVADPGEGPRPPLIFRPNCGPKSRKKFFWDCPHPPFISGSGWLRPLPYLKVWIRHCGGGVYITSVFYYTLEQGLFLPAILLNYSFRSGDYVAVITVTRHRPNSLYVGQKKQGWFYSRATLEA